jgi:hypothetical protein
MRLQRLRQKVGAVVLDWPRFETSLRTGRWFAFHNRDEQLRFDPTQPGAACDWQWSSELHLTNVFPRAGLRLMRAALEEWPIVFNEASPAGGVPDVSFVIGHRGMARLPLLLTTLRSIAAQTNAVIECVVVEQAVAQEAAPHLPEWVRYVHTPPPDPKMPFSRSWALNVGARAARGRILVLQDNDMLIPSRYAQALRERVDRGAEILDLKRFTFYLTPRQSEAVVAKRRLELEEPPQTIVQNLRGASTAVRRDTYFELGGFDETFVGWGGEDAEFWQRAQTRPTYSFGILPMVHLFHAPQPEKLAGENAPAIRRYHELATQPVATRIARLRGVGFGSLHGPQLS